MSLFKRIVEDQGPLSEGVKVGDYVAARDGRTGYASRVEAGMVYFRYDHHDHSEDVVLPVEEVNVTTVEDVEGLDEAGLQALRRRKQVRTGTNANRSTTGYGGANTSAQAHFKSQSSQARKRGTERSKTSTALSVQAKRRLHKQRMAKYRKP
jgi:hypothetical protein